MNRLPDWRARLYKTISTYEQKPFQYGFCDCAIFGSDIIQAITGDDPAQHFRGRYKTKIGGLRAIRKAGFRDQADYLEKTFETIHPAFAQVGDLGLIDTEEGPAIVVVLGAFAAGLGSDGLVRFQISEITKAFKVGG